MSTLTQEVRHVQNPALGSVLLWRFVCGYTKQHKTSDYPPLQLLFIVLPVVYHRETFAFLKSTNRSSGLHAFADKFSRSEVGKADVLFGVQSRALSWRSLSWASVRLGVHSRLFTLSRSTGTVIPLTTTLPTGVPASVTPLLSNAAKLGEWCAELSLFEIATILKVEF
jgi:hypothetical protein